MSLLWDDVFTKRAWGRWPSEAVVRSMAVLRRRLERPLRVLEVGCGPGAQLRFLAEEGDDAVGIDISIVALEQARLRFGSATSPLVQADGRILPIRTGEFDVVLDVETLCCLPEDARANAWAECRRVLRPSGHLLSLAFTTRCAGLDPTKQVSQLTYRDLDVGPFADLGTLSVLDDEGLVRLAGQAGLRIADVQRISRTYGASHLLIEEMVVLASPS